MAQIIRKTESTFPGPWLLDTAALAALDEIMDEQWSRLEAHKKDQIERVVRETLLDPKGQQATMEAEVEIRQLAEKDARYSGDGRTITLTLSSGNKIRVNSFGEATNDVNCQDHEIAKVEVKLYCGGIRGDLMVPTPDKSQRLSLITLPEASEQADELFVRLNRWAEQYKPDLFRQMCGMGPFGAWFSAAMLLLLILMIGVMTGAVSETNPVGDEIRELVGKGVRPEDYGRAFELLLLQSLSSASGVLHFPRWFGVAAVTAVIVASLLSVRARTAFEIGKGVASVSRQKRYDWFLRKAVPSFLIVGALASMLGSFAFEYLWSK